MKQILVMMAAAVLVGCSKDTPETSQAAEAEDFLKNDTIQKPDWSVEIEGYNLRRWDCPECQAKVSSLEFDCPKCDAAIDFSDQQPIESDVEYKERVEWEEKALGNDR